RSCRWCRGRKAARRHCLTCPWRPCECAPWSPARQLREGQLPLELVAAERRLEEAVRRSVLDDLLRHLLSGRQGGRPDRRSSGRERQRRERQRQNGAGGEAETAGGVTVHHLTSGDGISQAVPPVLSARSQVCPAQRT